MNQYEGKKHYYNLTMWSAGIMGSIIIPTLAYFTYMEFDNGNYGQSFMCALTLIISSYFPLSAIENNRMRNEQSALEEEVHLGNYKERTFFRRK